MNTTLGFGILAVFLLVPIRTFYYRVRAQLPFFVRLWRGRRLATGVPSPSALGRGNAKRRGNIGHIALRTRVDRCSSVPVIVHLIFPVGSRRTFPLVFIIIPATSFLLVFNHYCTTIDSFSDHPLCKSYRTRVDL